MLSNIVICDDSSFARNQIAKALTSFNVKMTLMSSGHDALDVIRDGEGDLLFLDLNMPEIDGYEVLKIIRDEDLEVMVVVVSGDIQPEATARVKSLGALAFIQKPINPEEITGILAQYGIVFEAGESEALEDVAVDIWDSYKEITNIAVGRAADLLARVLDCFVVMPIPNINMMEMSELKMTLVDIGNDNSVTGVCQGFIGSGISGEGLVIFNKSSINDIADLMKYTSFLDEIDETELIMDLSCIVLGSTLKGIAEQLDLNFSLGHPLVLGHHLLVDDLLKRDVSKWNQSLAMELSVNVENKDIHCDILLLFTEDSIEALNDRVSLVVD